MAITKQPPKIHTAFNPAMLHITTAQDMQDVVINIISQNRTIKRERESLNKVVMFDLSSGVNKLFEDLIKNSSITNGINLYQDMNLQVSYKVLVENRLLDFVAVNAVSQIGESSDLTKKRGQFLTGFERLKKYEGYELSVSFIGHEGQTTIKKNEVAIIDTPFVHGSLGIPDGTSSISLATGGSFVVLETNQSEVITNNQGQTIYVRQLNGAFQERTIYIDNLCTPINPFYVRWINQQGGWNYWMFSFRQYKRRAVEEQNIFNPVVYDQETAKDFSRLISLNAIEQITVGATNMTDNECEQVSSLVYSPIKEWYNEKLKKWIGLQVDTGNNEFDTRISKSEAEFTFNLPTRQLQFD